MIKFLRYAGLLLTFLLYSIGSISAQQKGDIVYTNDFNSKADLTGWKGRFRLVTKDGNSALMVKSNRKPSVDLPVEKLRGATLKVKARVKAQKVSTPPKTWNGIKIMLHSVLPWTDEFPQAIMPAGSFDWTDVEFTAFISPSVDTVRLVVGLENVSGRVWYDRIEITIEEPAQQLQLTPTAVAPYKGHNEPRLRGMMIPTFIDADGLRTLASWGANHVRWQLSWNGFPASKADTASLASYNQWLGTALHHIDTLLPLCRELDIKIVIDVHSLPGGRIDGSVHRMFSEKEWQQALRDVWKQIATRYKNEPVVWGYDIANEPIEGTVADGLMTWQQLATAVAQDIRTIDTMHAIIIEAAPAGVPEALEHFTPVQVPGVVYSFHMYRPMVFTHQGVNDTSEHVRYPGIIEGKEWNKATISKLLQGVKNWQNTHGVHIYVGEFSAIRWAPGESAYYYLRDCIEVFEEFGWDWAYHAFKEFNGWSIEHGTDRDDQLPSATPTLRQKLFLEWFGRNEPARD